MRKRVSFIILILVFAAGLSLLLYPTVSDYINSRNQSRAITDYASSVSELGDATSEQIWNSAQEYNAELNRLKTGLSLPESKLEEYYSQLNIADDGIMGYIDIPSIQCTLPIYHGTEEAVLQVGVGHVEGSSLPVGGESSHCVISGHRGLPSSKLFSKLDRLKKGDRFTLHVLNRVLTYEVDQILTVLPDEINSLTICDGEDLCTLVTCTPYGVNSHRLLVRGHRVANQSEEGVAVTADAVQIEPLLVALFMAAPLMLILLVILIISIRKKGSRR